ncbi:hypothetical protein BJ742DRAFT_96788 [Cladochytrium replicatum]|nr:hypothetical protein BJ742DRAFT_96788 [Cladochytrium replicatum]
MARRRMICLWSFANLVGFNDSKMNAGGQLRADSEKCVDLGMAVQAWGYMERALEKVLPILTYERQGYGLSSSPLTREEPRTVEDLARDLYLLLDQLNLLADGKLRKGRPLILVGHSFGGLILRAFQATYHPANVIGLVLLDPLPETALSLFPTIAPLITTRLHRALRTAASVSNWGLVRYMHTFLRIPVVPIPHAMRARLQGWESSALRTYLYDSKMLWAVAAEVAGYGDSLAKVVEVERGFRGEVEKAERAVIEGVEAEKEDKRGDETVGEGVGVRRRRNKENLATTALVKVSKKQKGGENRGDASEHPYRNAMAVVVTVAKVDKPVVGSGVDYGVWRRWWISHQRELARSLNSGSKWAALAEAIEEDEGFEVTGTDSGFTDEDGENEGQKLFIVDRTSEHAGLCVSATAVRAIQMVAEYAGGK